MELRVVDNPVLPDLRPLRERVPVDRLEILSPLSERERLLVCGVAAAIEELESQPPSKDFALTVLRRSFADAAGVAWSAALWEA